MESNKVLREYVYVDQRRLQAYYSQIREPDIRQKVPSWRVSLGLTGPKVEATQQIKDRPPTIHEMIDGVISYVCDNSLMQQRRTYQIESPEMVHQVFGLEKCVVTPAFLPAKREHQDQFKGLNVWISTYEEGQTEEIVVLYLLEDFPVDDRPEYAVRSGMSVLSILLNDYYEHYEKTIICENSVKEELGFDLYERKPNGTSIALNPSELLFRLGAQVGSPRSVRTFYRYRSTFLDYYQKYQKAIFAYPIFIQDLGPFMT